METALKKMLKAMAKQAKAEKKIRAANAAYEPTDPQRPTVAALLDANLRQMAAPDEPEPPKT